MAMRASFSAASFFAAIRLDRSARQEIPMKTAQPSVKRPRIPPTTYPLVGKPPEDELESLVEVDEAVDDVAVPVLEEDELEDVVVDAVVVAVVVDEDDVLDVLDVLVLVLVVSDDVVLVLVAVSDDVVLLEVVVVVSARFSSRTSRRKS